MDHVMTRNVGACCHMVALAGLPIESGWLVYNESSASATLLHYYYPPSHTLCDSNWARETFSGIFIDWCTILQSG